ncbi:hypothetical protein AAFF_G00236030 [Aldrovandia affinis]|uniref:Uncharacterized protein n=1 Tax=Aldrovandia affinis TaxID=143900 RepID=A0AAD7W445_9TELE|nr:hypothetical protein AAFF_G00236030 [Aldrovandia affinis]
MGNSLIDVQNETVGDFCGTKSLPLEIFKTSAEEQGRRPQYRSIARRERARDAGGLILREGEEAPSPASHSNAPQSPLRLYAPPPPALPDAREPRRLLAGGGGEGGARAGSSSARRGGDQLRAARVTPAPGPKHRTLDGNRVRGSARGQVSRK